MIRSQVEIDAILNRSQHALADVGNEVIAQLKVGVEDTDEDVRNDTYRLEIIRLCLRVLLNSDGTVKSYFLASANEKKYNRILDILQRLSGGYSGPAIPLLGRINAPVIYWPSTDGGPGTVTPTVPGFASFQNLSVDSPGEVVDSFDATLSSFAFYAYSVSGQNSGEGNRSGFFIVSWRGTSINMSGDSSTVDVGGNTTDVSFSVSIVSGQVKLTCNVPTNNWIVKGVRIT